MRWVIYDLLRERRGLISLSNGSPPPKTCPMALTAKNDYY
jgi:hypothetical protein